MAVRPGDRQVPRPPMATDFLQSRMPLNHTSREPLYYQLAVGVQHAITIGQLRRGHRLPAESKLARDCGLAVSTVRNAWKYLETKGAIVRRQGDGTFVN